MSISSSSSMPPPLLDFCPAPFPQLPCPTSAGLLSPYPLPHAPVNEATLSSRVMKSMRQEAPRMERQAAGSGSMLCTSRGALGRGEAEEEEDPTAMEAGGGSDLEEDAPAATADDDGPSSCMDDGPGDRG